MPGLVREILAEVKATGVGDNKNMLIELNVEQTRHNEIQMLGNGDWCVALGGRDCSLQMHEQKLVEVSITQEGCATPSSGRAPPATQRKATRPGAPTSHVLAAHGGGGRALRHAPCSSTSASTFECIVEGDRHYFMEVNTRIQVEHRVSELCYALRFTNPDDPNDAFDVHSLIEAMALIARHRRAPAEADARRARRRRARGAPQRHRRRAAAGTRAA